MKNIVINPENQLIFERLAAIEALCIRLLEIACGPGGGLTIEKIKMEVNDDAKDLMRQYEKRLTEICAGR